jgi:hypothetical protein
MFVQVIQGKLTDPSQARAALDRWIADLAPSATGWLGSTSGVTEDGTFITLARFASEDDARRNSDRPEQGEWWAETSKLFSGDVRFDDSTEVTVDLVGDPDQAGFVQVIRGKVTDKNRARELMTADSEDWSDVRPDILGSVTVIHDDGGITTAVYFTSEQAAREGEAKEPTAEMKAAMDEMSALSVGETEFYDLKDPWVYSPR